MPVGDGTDCFPGTPNEKALLRRNIYAAHGPEMTRYGRWEPVGDARNVRSTASACSQFGHFVGLLLNLVWLLSKSAAPGAVG